LIELMVKAGREREALAQCKLLPSDIPHRAELPRIVQGAVLAAAGKWAAALGPLRTAYQAGCRDALCLRWLAGSQLALGNLSDVEQVTGEWERLEPGNLEINAFRRAVEQRRSGGVTSKPPLTSRRVDGAPPHGLPIDVAPLTQRWTSPAQIGPTPGS
jgi:hypothetical protein